MLISGNFILIYIFISVHGMSTISANEWTVKYLLNYSLIYYTCHMHVFGI